MILYLPVILHLSYSVLDNPIISIIVCVCKKLITQAIVINIHAIKSIDVVSSNSRNFI